MIPFHIFVLKSLLSRFFILNRDQTRNYFLYNKIYEYVPEPGTIQKSIPCCVIKHTPGKLEPEDSVGLVRDTLVDGISQAEVLRSRYLQTNEYTIDFWLQSLAREITEAVITGLIYSTFSNLGCIRNQEKTTTEFEMLSLGIVNDIRENTYRKLVFRCVFMDVIYDKQTFPKLPQNIENYQIGVGNGEKRT